jgi:antitoxin (DNA-binding transcriptional repressor) of toxin-antitoxin stability system
VVIARNGKPLARLVPIDAPARRVFGQWKDEVWVYADGRIHPAGEPVVLPDLTEEEIAEWDDAPILTQGDELLFRRAGKDAA